MLDVNMFDQLKIGLATADQIRLRIFNTAGQHVRTLVDARRQAGAHQITWDGRDQQGRALASGLYLYRLEAQRAKFSQTRSMLLAR